MRREDFVKKIKDIIIEWVKVHDKEILNYKSYRWKHKDYEESVKTRNELEEAIKLSRKENNGGIDLETIDRIFEWGFGKKFPLRNEEEVISKTRKAFEFIEKGEHSKSVEVLMSINGVGIAGATKIIGLSDQEKLCIYDSRVGHALRDLKMGTQKIILCPANRGFKRDYDHATKHKWAENYEKLVWTLEVVRDYLKEKSYRLRIADIEMALFMMGE